MTMSLPVRLRAELAHIREPGPHDGPDDVVAPAPPVRMWRHRERHVLGQDRYERIDVAPLPGGDVALDELAHAGIAERAHRALLGAVRQCLGERPPCALKRAVDGGGRRVELLGDLAGREAEYVAQDQYGSLRGSEML